MRPFIEINPEDTGRADRFRNVHGLVWIPLNDIDFLVMQLADNGLDAHALDADARAHGIDPLLHGSHSHFGPLTRFAGDRADLHHPMINFWNFVFQQPAQEILGAPVT